MRPLAILSVLLVLLAAFALTPSARAAETDPFDLVCGPTAMCTSVCDSPDLCNDAGCPYPAGAEQGTTVTVGGTTVHNDCGPQSLCSGPMRCTSPFDQAAYLPVCIQPQVEQGPVRFGVDQCRQDHETYPACASAQRIHVYQQQGPVWAQIHVCFPHTPPPDLGLAANNPGPCGAANPYQRCPAPYPIRPCEALEVADVAAVDPLVAPPGPRPEVSLQIADDCHVNLYVKYDVMDCLFGEQYNPTHVGPLVTVWVWGCAPPYPPQETMAVGPPCTCPPPRPLCYDVNRAIAWNDDVWMDDSCNVTVELEASCGLQGYDQHEERIGKVTLRYQTCQQPPQE